MIKRAAALLPLAASLWADGAASCDSSSCGPVPEDRRIPVGGQAVIEGVLMKGPEHWGLTVRDPDGSLWSKAWLGADWLKRGAWRLPIVRGFANMVEMMRVGCRALTLSSERALGEEQKFSFVETAITILVAIALVAGLFIALPVWASERLAAMFGASETAKNVMEGVTRGLIFVGYVAIVGMWGDIKRVFSYHGAEHKTINAYEQGLPLTPESVAGCSRIHRRCGTSFLVIVVVVSIAIFSIARSDSFAIRAALRVLLLPVVIGVSYEIIKAASRSDTWGKALIMPALTLQYITTRVPDLPMIEVAIRSLEVALDPSSIERMTQTEG